jgi:hypothetical protein
MLNKSWIEKLTIQVKEDNPDGTCDIVIDWDETDPDLELWNSWGEEGQKAFVLDALRTACDNVLAEAP